MKTVVKAVLFGIILGTALPAAAQNAPTPSSHLAGVTGALAKLVGSTKYIHEKDASGAVIKPIGDGTYDIEADCSGWVSHNLEKLPQQYAAVREYQPQVAGEAAMPYPRAHVYRQYFANLPLGAPFTRIGKLADVQPGDILAWCLPGHCGIPFTGKAADDTGHVMIVAGKPIPNDANSAFLLVLDSSSVIHYTFGTLPAAIQAANPSIGQTYASFPNKRTQADGGVAPGFILFGTAADGSIDSFQFGPKDHVNSQGILFAVGRAVPPGRPVASN